jgi:hypothetical protein
MNNFKTDLWKCSIKVETGLNSLKTAPNIKLVWIWFSTNSIKRISCLAEETSRVNWTPCITRYQYQTVSLPAWSCPTGPLQQQDTCQILTPTCSGNEPEGGTGDEGNHLTRATQSACPGVYKVRWAKILKATEELVQKGYKLNFIELWRDKWTQNFYREPYKSGNFLSFAVYGRIILIHPWDTECVNLFRDDRTRPF